VIRQLTRQTTGVTAAASQLQWVVFRLQRGWFFGPKGLDEVLSGDRGAPTSQACAEVALRADIGVLSMFCNGDGGYLRPSGTGAASYRGVLRACTRLAG
jgi:hypothetical protein